MTGFSHFKLEVIKMSEIYVYGSSEHYGRSKIFEITYDELSYHGYKCRKVIQESKVCSKRFSFNEENYYLFYDEKTKDRGITSNCGKCLFSFWYDYQNFVPERFMNISRWALMENLGIKIIVSLK